MNTFCTFCFKPNNIPTIYNAVSEAPNTAPAPKKYQSYSKYKTDEEKKEEVCVCVCMCVCVVQACVVFLS